MRAATVPWITGDPRVSAQLDAAFQAVLAAFPYFDEADILAPATGDNPCALARQVFIFLLVHAFHLPKKRVAAFGTVSLNKIKGSCRSIDRRIASRPRFAGWMHGVRSDALSRFQASEWFHG